MRRAVFLREILPGSPKRPVEHGLGQECEAVANLHDRQVATEVGNRDTKQVDALELRERLHLRFAVGIDQMSGFTLEFCFEFRFADPFRVDARVQQLVEKYRESRELLRHVSTPFAEADESRRGEPVFVEQCDIGTAAENPFDDGERALECEHGILALRDQAHEARHESLQTLL